MNLLQKAVYSAGISCYRFGVKVASIRNRKAKLLDSGQKDVFAKIGSTIKPGDEVVWVHAASLGEFEQGRPVIEAIKREYPEKKVLVTFFSPSGYEVRKNYRVADCVCYLPFDTPGRVRRFLDAVNPQVALFVKYEFWANYLMQLADRGIPTFLISAVFRPDQIFFKPYGRWYAGVLKCFSRIFVQDSGSKRLLEGIGIESEVSGDTRFDRVTDIMESRQPIPEIESFAGVKGDGERPFVVVFGSSWPEDEAVYGDWLREREGVKAVIAPHEFDSSRLAKLKEIVPGEVVLMSEVKADSAAAEGKRVMVIDCFGILSSAYAYADVAYVGGGFGVSIHNINEAAVYGIPVLFGPENRKFIEAQDLKALGGGMEVEGKETFSRIADSLYYDPVNRAARGKWAGEYISDNRGATGIIMSGLGEIL